MAGKQEHKPGVVINYKNKLDDRFVDLATQKTTSEANEYLTQFNTNLHSENTQTVGSVSPYFYHSNARPGAKSPMSVEMAQHIFRNTLNALEDALRAEIARAFSSEKYLSDFMKENMVTKSEDQVITGFKDFDSVQIDHADIDTELVDEGTTNDLTVRNRLQIPLGAPQTRKTGDIWYDANITSPGGTSGGGETTRSITVHQESTNEVSMYDGSVLAASFSVDNTINNITLNGKTIKIPKGVILGNMNGSDSIDLRKNERDNSVSFNIKDEYIEAIADDRTDLKLIPVEQDIANVKSDIVAKDQQINNKVDSSVLSLSTELKSKFESVADANSSTHNQLVRFQDQYDIFREYFYTSERNILNSISSIETRLDGIDGNNGSIAAIKTRLEALDGDGTTSLKNQVASLNSSLATLSTSLSSILTEVAEIKNVINSLHGEGTI